MKVKFKFYDLETIWPAVVYFNAMVDCNNNLNDNFNIGIYPLKKNIPKFLNSFIILVNLMILLCTRF